MNFLTLELLKNIDGLKDKLIEIFFLKKSSYDKVKPLTKRRIFHTANDSLQFNAKLKEDVNSLTAGAKKIFKKYIENPDELLKFIESKGTKVLKVKNAEKILLFINEQEGFIYPLKGFNALFLTIALNIFSPGCIKIGFETPAMFVLSKNPVNIYFTAHQFHHWLGYIKGLPGYEERTLDNFKNIWKADFNVSSVTNMSFSEILDLKEAIARDLEAIKFVKELAREYIGSKASVQKLKEGKSLNL